MSGNLQIKNQISVVNDNGTLVTLPETVTQHEYFKGETEASLLIDNVSSDTMVTPITISLSQIPNTTCFALKAEYVDTDLTSGIKAGDRAKFQVRFDSGNWMEVYSVLLEGYKPTTASMDIRAQGTKKILVKRTISASQ